MVRCSTLCKERVQISKCVPMWLSFVIKKKKKKKKRFCCLASIRYQFCWLEFTSLPLPQVPPSGDASQIGLTPSRSKRFNPFKVKGAEPIQSQRGLTPSRSKSNFHSTLQTPHHATLSTIQKDWWLHSGCGRKHTHEKVNSTLDTSRLTHARTINSWDRLRFREEHT